MNTIIKALLAAILLGCLLKMPYGYYQFVRLAGCAGFAYLAYQEFEFKRAFTGILCAIAAILFNPIIKIHFKRQVWNNIDLVLAAGLIIWIVIDLVYLFHGSRKERKKTD